MARPEFVEVPPQPLDRYRPLLGSEYEVFEEIAGRARKLFSGRAVWHVNSTHRGGGVAEMLRALLPYVRGVGVDTRWVVLRDGPDFFTITKRLHNNLHGDPGDGGSMGKEERAIYEETLAESARHLTRLLQPGDVVYLHDPQTAGLVPAVRDGGVGVIWRCHIGVDEPNDLVRRAWDFLRPYVEQADAYVFSRPQYVWEGLDVERAWMVPPSVDPFSPKNQEMEPVVVEAILGEIGLGPHAPEAAPVFTRGDGTPGRVERRAKIHQEEPLPAGARLVAQVSRWDRLKDPMGLLECFARHLDDPGAHLVLAGPSAGAVSDDPEGAGVLEAVADAWRRLPEETRRRAHLAVLPMEDIDENGAMVNAIQRRADVLVQKSLAEGFGMTVAEGMWKARPMVGSRVGGIQDQIVDGESGVLVDPGDLEGFARAIRELLDDPDRAARLGEAARRRIRESFLGIHRLGQYVDLIAGLGAEEPPARPSV
ncbi:MAG TPA: glycosyltransferase [Solirubrobacterales bacterium]|nr:glycosyltransferase [Solirubrobacterales bacterium]